MSWAAIIVAAGRGSRFGRPKQLVELAGKPMLAWSVETFASMPEITSLIVTTELEFNSEFDALVRRYAPHVDARVVAGGEERQDSVRLALQAVNDRCAYVLVHDGARPMVRADDTRRAMAAVAPGVAALLAIPVVDTIKEVGSDGKVVRTLERRTLWAAQTPQLATTADMMRAHREAHDQCVRATDDAALLERCGIEVAVVEGSAENFKVTVPLDLERAAGVLRERSAATK